MKDWHDMEGTTLAPGDTILDASGDLWRVPTEDNYQWQAWARVRGCAYTHGLTLLDMAFTVRLQAAGDSGTLFPSTRADGGRWFARRYACRAGPRIEKEIRERRWQGAHPAITT